MGIGQNRRKPVDTAWSADAQCESFKNIVTRAGVQKIAVQRSDMEIGKLHRILNQEARPFQQLHIFLPGVDGAATGRCHEFTKPCRVGNPVGRCIAIKFKSIGTAVVHDGFHAGMMSVQMPCGLQARLVGEQLRVKVKGQIRCKQQCGDNACGNQAVVGLSCCEKEQKCHAHQQEAV